MATKKIDPLTLDLVDAGLRGFAAVKNPATDEVGWIAFKFGCTARRAKQLIDAARQRAEGKKP